MNVKVEVDKNSVFCPGVIRAVEIAETKQETGRFSPWGPWSTMSPFWEGSLTPGW